MHTTKLVSAVAVTLTVLAVGLALFLVRANREVEASLAAALRDNETLSTKPGAVRLRLIAAETAATELRQSLDEARAAKVAEDARAAKAAAAQRAAQPARPSVSPALSPEAVLAGREFTARHPEVKQAALDLHRALMAGQFGPFFKARGFTAEQIETFTNAMQGGAGVFRSVPDADGKLMVLSTPSWGDADKRHEENAQLMALLGPDGIRELQGYVQQLPARRLAAQLASALYFTPTPLTTEQANQFVRVVSEATPRDSARSGATDWNAVLTRSQGVLLEPQLATLSRFQAQERYNTAMNQAFLRSQQPGNKP